MCMFDFFLFVCFVQKFKRSFYFKYKTKYIDFDNIIAVQKAN